MTTPPSDAITPPGARRLSRFTQGQRWTHTATAVLMLGCLATAAALYIDPISVAVGHRAQVRAIHLWSGYLLPIPVILAIIFSRAARADARTLDGFSASDKAWLRSRTRRSGRIRVGKYNAGQKLNAAVSTAAVVVLIISGSVMLDLMGVWPLPTRTGATFVHDWVSLGLFLLIAGHLWFAFRDPEAMHAITKGTVTEEWAYREHAAWADEQFGSTDLPSNSLPPGHVAPTTDP